MYELLSGLRLAIFFDHGSEDGCISNSSYGYLQNRAIFHFHDFGRKSNMTIYDNWTINYMRYPAVFVDRCQLRLKPPMVVDLF